MSQELEKYLQQALDRLEVVKRKILETQGYSEEAMICQMLEEIAKEQMPHENPRHSAHTAR